jgi:hypothetical protein
MVYHNGRSYEGDWVDDMRQGEGIERYPNGHIYKGAFKNGKKEINLVGKAEGHGEYLWQNGEKYIGEWKNGLKEGKGRWESGNGDFYDGDWKNSKAHGNGLH